MYGSEIYGVVGPAVELGLYQHGSFERFKEAISELPVMQSTLKDSFSTMSFPEQFHGLFGKSKDYVHEGIVKSFKYAAPNTFNRLIDVTTNDYASFGEFIDSHPKKLSFSRRLSTDNERFLMYMLNLLIDPLDDYAVELERTSKGLKVHSSADTINAICDEVESLYKKKQIELGNMPQAMRDDVKNKLGQSDISEYLFFVGRPEGQLNRRKVYVPFDFLVRGDAAKLIGIMEEGQRGTQ